MQIETILFDMDGVLIDTEQIILEAAIIGLKEFGVNAEPEDFAPFVGAGETRYLGGPSAKYGVEFDPRMKTIVYEIYADLLKEHPDAVYPGVLETVREIQQKFKTAVCSAADRTKVEHNLNAIGIGPEFFTALVTGSDVEKQKPFPDIYLKGASLCNTEPEKCIAIDDTLNGIKAANAAGCVSVAVTTTYSAQELIDEAKPDYIIDDIRKFPGVIKEIIEK